MGKTMPVLACEELELCPSGLLAASFLTMWSTGVIFSAPCVSFRADRETCFLGAQALKLSTLLDLVTAHCGPCLWMEVFTSAQRNTNSCGWSMAGDVFGRLILNSRTCYVQACWPDSGSSFVESLGDGLPSCWVFKNCFLVILAKEKSFCERKMSFMVSFWVLKHKYWFLKYRQCPA